MLAEVVAEERGLPPRVAAEAARSPFPLKTV